MASSMHDDEEQPSQQPSSSSTMSWKEKITMFWKEKMEFPFMLLSMVLLLVVIVQFVVHTVHHNPFHDRPARFSVELVGARGIAPPAAAPGAASPAFDLLVHIDNGHIFDMWDDVGGDAVVSYAGVPLARGRIPAFYVDTKKAVTVAVGAASGGVGIPEGLFRLMAEERRRLSGVAPQLEIDLWWSDYGFFTCRVELDGEQRSSECEKHNFIYSS